MSNIQTYLQQILDAVYGEEVRGSIHDAIATMNSDLENAIRDDLNPLAFKGDLGVSGGTNNNLNNLVLYDHRGIWRLLGSYTYTNAPLDFDSTKSGYLVQYSFGGSTGQAATVIKQEVHYFSNSGANANIYWSRVYLSGEWQSWHKNVDNTLSIEGAAADAKAVGDMKSVVNQALLQPIESQSITVKDGYYDYLGFHSSSSFKAAEYLCNSGERILLTCSGNSSFCGYYIYDQNGSRIAGSELDKVYEDYELVVPNGGVKIGLNQLNGSEGKAYSLSVKKASTDNPYYVTELEDKVNQSLLQPIKDQSITVKEGYYDYLGFHASSGFNAAEYACASKEKVFLTCSGNSSFCGYYIYDQNGSRIAGSELDKVYEDYELVVPNGGTKIGLNQLGGSEGRADILSVKKATTDNPYYITELENKIKAFNYWEGKSILWLGTSIPEGGATINGKWNTYPGLIADELGTTIYNRAKGSSMMRAGDHTRVTQNDPFGWTGRHYTVPAYSLSMTIAEKQDFINNYSYWKTKITGAPDSLSDAEKSIILSCSYENRLLPYLSSGEHPVDLFIIDHGYNDAYNNTGAAKEDVEDMLAEPSNPTDRTYFLGALRYLLNIILEDNPKARIAFVGHYESDRYTAVYKAQEKAHAIWGYPLFRTWEYMGFSQNVINGSTILRTWCPDDIHPHSGGANTLIHYANVVYPFIRDLRK